MGALRRSDDGYDKHDLKELPPFAPPYLTIVFPQTNWGDKAGNYATNFHQARYWRLGDEWEFVVTSDKAREVTLSWEGNNGIKRFWRMRLQDMETGEIVRVIKNKKLQTYTFDMVGTTHRFKWIYVARPAS